MIRNDELIIPEASSVDYLNAEEVEGYALYLSKLYEHEGGYELPRRSTPIIRTVESELRTWCDQVNQMLPKAPLPVIAALLPTYDFAYRIAYHAAPSPQFLSGVRVNAVKRWAEGEKTISSAAIVRILREEIHGAGYKALSEKYVRFYFSIINDWVEELQISGRFFRTPKEETFARLTLIMGETLFGEYGPDGAENDKRRWAESHVVEDLTTLTTPELRSYIEFMTSASETCSFPTESYIALFSELNKRQDLNPYLHSALTLDLTQKALTLKKSLLTQTYLIKCRIH